MESRLWQVSSGESEQKLSRNRAETEHKLNSSFWVCAVGSIACNVIGQKPNSKLNKTEQKVSRERPRFHGKGLFRLVTHFCVGSNPLFWLLIQDCIYPFVWVGNSKPRKAKRNGLRGFVRVVVGLKDRDAPKRNSKRNAFAVCLAL
mgnify:CR=1 FL=1|jgi:hypothetical protein